MEIIFETKFGSHLFGTATPSSDHDFKGIFIPSASDILLPRIPDVKTMNTGDKYSKNTSEDVDREFYSVHKFFDMLISGDMVACEMLFAPVTHPVHPVYNKIRSNRDKMISREIKGFLGYCRRQANLYSVKGERLNDVRRVTEYLFGAMAAYGSSTKLQDNNNVLDMLTEFSLDLEHCSIEYIQSQGKDLWHFVCCDRKAPATVSLKTAHDMFKRVLDEYGNRAKLAAEANGIDWKAISHAVRVGEEAIELLTTGEIVFPRPNAARLLSIKLGNEDYAKISSELDFLLETIEQLVPNSVLPAKADVSFMSSLREEIYANQVLKEYTTTDYT